MYAHILSFEDHFDENTDFDLSWLSIKSCHVGAASLLQLIHPSHTLELPLISGTAV
jgi:hypothetical protein